MCSAAVQLGVSQSWGAAAQHRDSCREVVAWLAPVETNPSPNKRDAGSGGNGYLINW
jgi:hypothetical protein